jgi:hypothetical protein
MGRKEEDWRRKGERTENRGLGRRIREEDTCRGKGKIQ